MEIIILFALCLGVSSQIRNASIIDYSFYGDNMIRDVRESCQFKPFSPMRCSCGVDVSKENLHYRQYELSKEAIADNHAHPWIASFYEEKYWSIRATIKPFCMGTLISPEWILTARQCFSKLLPEVWVLPEEKPRYIVSAGDYLPFRFEIHQQWRQVIRLVLHPGRRYYTKNDLALAKVKVPFDLGFFVNVACLPWPLLHCDLGGEPIRVTGYRFTYSHRRSLHLHHALMMVLPKVECNRRHWNDEWELKYSETDYSFCGFWPDLTLNYGDIGGPALLYRKDYVFVVGIVSKVLAKNHVTGFTRVTAYVDWIEFVTDGVTCIV